MKGFSLYIFIFCLFLSFPYVNAQEPHYRNYDIEDGLPSNEIYHVIQDKKGFIWIATDKGVSRFDGYEFENFGLEDGLPDNTIFEIYEDYKGRIWFISFSLKLSYYYKGEIHIYPFNASITEQFYKNRVQNKLSFHVDKEDNVYIGIRNVGLTRIDSTGKTYQLTNNRDHYLDIFKIEDRFLVSQTTRNYKSVRIHYEDSTLVINEPIKQQNNSSLQNNDFIVEQGHKFIIAHERKLYSIDPKLKYLRKKKEFVNNVVWLSSFGSDKLWVSTSSGILVVDNENFNTSEIFLKKHFVTSVLEDNEGSHWFTTRSSGLFYAPNLSIKYIDKRYGLPSDNIKEIAFDSSGVLWMGNDDPVISKLNDGKIENKRFPESRIKGLRKIEYDFESNRILVSRDNGFYSIKNNNINLLSEDSPFDIISLGRDTLMLSYAGGVRMYQNHRFFYNSCEEDSFCRRITKLFEDSDGKIYMGGLDGLWLFEDGTYKHLGYRNDDLYYRITDIGRLGKYLAISTQGAGIIFIGDNDYVKIAEDDGLISNSINDFFIDGKILWIGTNQGISKLKLSNTNNFDYNILNITPSKGLPYPQINDIEVNNSMVYVATTKGLSYFPKDQIRTNKAAPDIFIRNVEINGVDTTYKARYDLEYDQGYLSFQYVGLAYRENGRVRYRYRLEGLDTNWHYTKETSKSFMGLPPGNYTFTVMAQNEDGVWSDNPQSISFTIKKPFYTTYWFIILVVVFIGGLIALFVYYRLRMIRKRNALMQDINEYKQKILRQQMNPHFIFNTLNSIQYFLLDEDTTSSLTYLTKFAKMMRIILDNSQHTFVPIEDEIRGLDLYLELEALRFEESFDYEIKVDEKINPFEYKIPALLLQPYVENSIRHGLLHKRDKGFLKVEIKLSEDALFCIIEDDGIGRKRAEQIKMTKGPLKKSLGSKITEDRIKVLNSLYSNEIDINYVDLTDNEGNPNGTRVEIKLPFVF